MTRRIKSTKTTGAFYERIREILESARSNVARTVNTTQVVANWLIGREIVEEEQRGQDKAEYGRELLKNLAARLHNDYGQGFSVSALQYMVPSFCYFRIYSENNTRRVLNPHRKRVQDKSPRQRVSN